MQAKISASYSIWKWVLNSASYPQRDRKCPGLHAVWGSGISLCCTAVRVQLFTITGKQIATQCATVPFAHANQLPLPRWWSAARHNCVSTANTKTFQPLKVVNNTFSSAAPQIWNHIPTTIKVSPLKTPSNVTSKHTILPLHNFLST